MGFTQFQIGTGTKEKKIAANCASCHDQTTIHSSRPVPYDTDYCLACHDYGHFATGDMFKNQGGTSLSGWSGFGSMPISRRVHGIHKGAYLEHPEEVYANATKDTFGHIIFPNDIRNCTKCHSDGNTTWKEKPSRVACLACHDTDAAKAHGKLNTFVGDLNDPYGPLSFETCTVCHGKDREFSPDKLHKITNPYVPPYPKGE
jgi:OmcA/MtrC family decaheme c-type cytochrome